MYHEQNATQLARLARRYLRVKVAWLLVSRARAFLVHGANQRTSYKLPIKAQSVPQKHVFGATGTTTDGCTMLRYVPQQYSETTMAIAPGWRKG